MASNPNKRENTQNELNKFLKEARDWDKLPTSVAGISVVKIPATRKQSARLAIEVLPLDESGNPVKRKGIFLTSERQRRDFVVLLEDEGCKNLMGAIESFAPQKTPQRKLDIDLEN